MMLAIVMTLFSVLGMVGFTLMAFLPSEAGWERTAKIRPVVTGLFLLAWMVCLVLSLYFAGR